MTDSDEEQRQREAAAWVIATGDRLQALTPSPTSGAGTPVPSPSDQAPPEGATSPLHRTITSVVTVEVPDDAPVPFPGREERLDSFLDN